jgi:tRNA A-37 threonylcarbamoyl transferase component Bud32
VAPEIEPFAVPGWTGRIVARHLPAGPALGAEVARLADPGSAAKTLHWGRNYLYLARFAAGAAGPLDVVVKQFRRDGRRERRRRTSKAARSFEAALALGAAGIATPEPILVAESADPRGPCLYVCRYLPEAIEARYLFRARNAGTLAETFPGVDFAAFVAALGRLLRRLHDAGIWHRDVSGGNILLPAPRAAAARPEDLHLVDLNRARLGRRPTASERSRDLSRLALGVAADRERLLAAYWGEGEVTAPRRALYATYRRAFLAKNGAKPRLRGARERLRALLLPRRPHAHIPPAPAGAAARDKVVWDALSDQPHQHAGRLEKLGVRLGDAPAHARELAVVAGAAPRTLRRYREIRRELARPDRAPVPFTGIGVGLRPDPQGTEPPEAVVAAVAELGVRRVLLRLHPWERGPAAHGAEEALARALAAAGVELTFALPQSRELVKDPGRWRAAIAEIGLRFRPYGRRFQVGHAINRSKWGIWNLGEYMALATAACEVLRAQGEVEILGPAVIDFEYHATAAVLNLRRPGLRFDGVSALLYVDRRGAPESRQAGFDPVGKVALLKAIAETARNSTGRCWVTEVNWPLWEGPHSPAGRAVSVGEETQADYLARYYLQVLGTGLIEGVFWWQLAARGYGLLEPRSGGRARRRPAFDALRTLVAELEGSRLEGILPASPPARLYRFRRSHLDGAQVVAAWSARGDARATLPRPAATVTGRDGEPLPVPAGREVEVGPSVRYFRLVD